MGDDTLTSNSEAQSREHRTVKVEGLKPNEINGQVFTTSLTDLSIEKLAENIHEVGLRQPLEIRPDGTILDGHRRWLAVRHLGWDEVEVVVVPDVEDDEAVEGYVLDAFSTTRDATVGERVRIYGLALRVLQRRHGRAPGRPRKSGSNDPGFWSREEIAAEAAKIAGFGSAGTARRATAVIESGHEDTIAAIENGELSISAAHGKLRVPSSQVPSDDAETSEDLAPEPDADDDATDGDAAVPQPDKSPDPVEPVDEQQDGLADDHDDQGDDEDEDPGTGDDDEPDPVNPDDDVSEVPLKTALEVVMAAMEAIDHVKAVRAVRAFAHRGGVECWIPHEDDDHATKLSDLHGHATEVLEQYASDDIRAASMWVERAVEDMNETLALHTPDDDEDVDNAE